jgi:hypothetical protein
MTHLISGDWRGRQGPTLTVLHQIVDWACSTIIVIFLKTGPAAPGRTPNSLISASLVRVSAELSTGRLHVQEFVQIADWNLQYQCGVRAP